MNNKQENRIALLKSFLKSDTLKRIVVNILGIIIILLMVLAAVTPIRYNLRVGMVPTHTISASKDVIDEISTEKNRKIAAESVAPTYKLQDGVTEKVLNKLELIKNELFAVIQYAKTLEDYSFDRRYTKEELDYAADMLSEITLRSFQLQSLMNTSEEDFNTLFSSLKDTIANTMQGSVSEGQENSAINSIVSIIGYSTEINVLQNVAMPVLREVIMPNMVIDIEATEFARQAARDAVDPVVYKQGQNIVVRGEGRIKENQIKMLDSLGLLDTDTTDYKTYVGATIIVLLSLLGLMLCLNSLDKNVFLNTKRLILIYLVLSIGLLFSILAKIIGYIYAAPLLFVSIILSASIGYKPALLASAVFSAIASFMLAIGGHNTAADACFMLISGISSGSISALMLKDNSRRTHVLMAGFVGSAISALTLIAAGLMVSNDTSLIFSNAAWSSMGGIISTLLSIGIQPMLETLFNLPTQSRLIDLCNPKQPLMNRLLTEAPGTYHHSLIIANLAEACAERVGANPYLARAGGYYHDIGKLKRPKYFKENQINQENILNENEPQVAAAIITAHIRDGLVYAKQHRLPVELQNIISEHHGNSLVMYFYSKAVLQEGKENVNEDDYRYDSVPPRSVEGAIVMLCDTIEAAVRSLKHPSMEEIVEFIIKLIQQKIDDGQLRNAPLTIDDLHGVAESCAKVLYGVFHERVEYPSRNKHSKLQEKLPSKKKEIDENGSSESNIQGDAE
ncbi:MAG: HDIG domain-containing protein [Christensenellaceae bacterium]|nr:HDIG domain-containing protein [Christensenellaceae bacterium]